ncbi:MAG: hypothetical protein CMF67_13350 [Magnetovibrio sp.]|nr:hypothetical protein [Magnetovibrio sp.]
MIVFLADLQNSYYRYLRNSVPIGMGYVYAYIDKIFGDDIEVYQFRKFEDMHTTMEDVKPDLVAFGSYSWNTSLTKKTAAYLRERFPDTVIAVGGPDISENISMAATELRASVEYDFVMPNEGEGPVRALIEGYKNMGSRERLLSAAIPGCVSRAAGGNFQGQASARFADDINEIPSPYFDGFMDEFLANPDYLPIIQTSRGCPYRCTFCVSGKDSWRKVKSFEIDRVKAEIDYVADRATNKYLRLADENFGILHRDEEIAEYIVKKRRDTGFPNAVSIYTDKHPTERVKNINKLLKDCLPFCISFQSATPTVLDAIKRINLKDKEVESAVGFAREHGLMLVTELIFPLPGETRQSFLASVDKLIGQRFESISINHMTILKGTEMALPEDREKHGVIGKFLMSENGYTEHPHLQNVEVDEIVVGNNTLPEDEVHEINKFVFLLDFAHNRSLFKELLFFFDSHGVSATELLCRIAEQVETYPILGARASQYAEGVRDRLFETRDDVREFVMQQMETEPNLPQGIHRVRDNLIIDVLIEGEFDLATDEICAAGEAIIRARIGSPPDEFFTALDILRLVTQKSYIPVDERVEEVVTVTSPFDLSAWIEDNYRSPLQDYSARNVQMFQLRNPNPPLFESIWNDQRESRRDKFVKAFLQINSANRRRVISQA